MPSFPRAAAIICRSAACAAQMPGRLFKGYRSICILLLAPRRASHTHRDREGFGLKTTRRSLVRLRDGAGRQARSSRMGSGEGPVAIRARGGFARLPHRHGRFLATRSVRIPRARDILDCVKISDNWSDRTCSEACSVRLARFGKFSTRVNADRFGIRVKKGLQNEVFSAESSFGRALEVDCRRSRRGGSRPRAVASGLRSSPVRFFAAALSATISTTVPVPSTLPKALPAPSRCRGRTRAGGGSARSCARDGRGRLQARRGRPQGRRRDPCSPRPAGGA